MQLRRSKKPNEIWQRLRQADILLSDGCAPGSFFYGTNGAFLRTKLYGEVKDKLRVAGYSEIVLPNVLTADDVAFMNAIDEVEDLYFPCADQFIAPTHEAAFYTYLKHKMDLADGKEIKVFNFGPAIRKRKKTYPIFRIGERTSFLEAYAYIDAVHVEEAMLKHLYDGHAFVSERLYLPSILVDRPAAGNKKFNDKTFAVEILTRDGRTFTGPMVYRQSERFLEMAGISRSGDYMNFRVVHTGYTDNIFFAAMDYYFSVDKVILPWAFCPTHVQMICDNEWQDHKNEDLSRTLGPELRVNVVNGAVKRNRTKVANACFEQGIPIVVQLTERKDWDVRTIFEKSVRYISSLQDVRNIATQTARINHEFLTSQRKLMETEVLEASAIDGVRSVVDMGKLASVEVEEAGKVGRLAGIEFLGEVIDRKSRQPEKSWAIFGRRI